jgi:hypothetical protein
VFSNDDEWFVAGGDVTAGSWCLAIDLSMWAMAVWMKRATHFGEIRELPCLVESLA